MKTDRQQSLWFLAGLLLVTAWFVGNWRTTPIDPETGEFAVLDSQSAWRMRRVGLAIASTRLAQTDGFASFPHEVSSQDLPLFDELLALAARLFSGGAVGKPGVAFDESALRRLAIWIGPVLLCTWLVALYGLLRRSARFSTRACLVALAVVVASPVVVDAGRPGTIWIELFLAILWVLQLQAVFALWRAERGLDQFTNAMIAGGIGGVGLATSPIYLVPTAIVWLSFIFACLRERDEERADVVRAALLFWITLAIGGLLPSLGGPWVPAESGAISGWTDLWGKLVLVGAAPLLLMSWSAKWRGSKHSPRYMAGLLLLLVSAGLVAMFAMGPDHEATALLFASVGWDSVGPGSMEVGLLAFALLWCLPWIAGFVLVPRGTSAEDEPQVVRVMIWLAGIACLALALVHPPSSLLFAVPTAYVVARLVDARGGRRQVVAGVVGLLVIGYLMQNTESRAAVDEERMAALRASRWLRANTDPTGAWNSVHAVHDWGVLVDPALASLVVYHSRRAGASLGVQRNADAAGRFGLEELLASSSPREFARHAHALGLRFMITSPRSAERWARFGAQPEVLAALPHEATDSGTPTVRRVWQSAQGEDGPGLVILSISRVGER